MTYQFESSSRAHGIVDDEVDENDECGQQDDTQLSGTFSPHTIHQQRSTDHCM